MSKEFKMVLIGISILMVVGFGFFVWQEQSQMNYTNTAHQSMDDLKATGQVEVKSYEEWNKTNKTVSKKFEAWRAKELKKQKEQKEQKEIKNHQ